jgi:hypothetical protein
VEKAAFIPPKVFLFFFGNFHPHFGHKRAWKAVPHKKALIIKELSHYLFTFISAVLHRKSPHIEQIPLFMGPVDSSERQSCMRLHEQAAERDKKV